MALGVGPNDYTFDPASGSFKRLGGRVAGAVVPAGTAPTAASSMDGAPRYTSATAPQASSSWAGKFIRVLDAGQDEALWACLQDADGVWAWCVVYPHPVTPAPILPGWTRQVFTDHQAVFELWFEPVDGSLFVILMGQVLEGGQEGEGADYVLDGTTLTLLRPLEGNDRLVVRYQANLVL